MTRGFPHDLNLLKQKEMTTIERFLDHLFSLKEFILSILLAMRIIKNWYALILIWLIPKRSIPLKSRIGVSREINCWKEYELFRDELYCSIPLIFKPKLNKLSFHIDDVCTFVYKGRKLTFTKEYLHDSLNMILVVYETFALEQYKNILLDPPSQIVDIGANMGDSSVYFALNGMDVIAYEPYRKAYLQAVANFKKNYLDKSIIIYNAGAGISHQTNLDFEMETRAGQPLVENPKGSAISILSFHEIYSAIDFSKKTSLKIDCEGCEYDFFLNADAEELGKFHSIIGEYHYGYRRLQRKLSDSGFKVLITTPRSRYNKDSQTLMITGNFYAFKVENR